MEPESGCRRASLNQQIWRDRHVMLACDTDLLNEAELTAAVGQRAEASNLRSTTAALLAALYERFGCDFVEKLRGAFSVVLWDRRERRFLAAIDGFGMKRLVYYHERQGVTDRFPRGCVRAVGRG